MRSDKWKTNHACKCIASNVITDGDSLRILLQKSIYSYGKAVKLFEDIKGDSMYHFHISMKAENAEYKVVFTCLDEKKVQLTRGYLKEKDRIVTPENTTVIEISVIGFAKNQEGVVSAENIELDYIGPYEARLVTVATVGVDYETDVPRTFEKNMTQNLERIDDIMREKKTDLVVLTECVYSRCVQCTVEEGALSLTDEPIRRFQAKAKEHGTYLAFSIREKRDGRLYNTGVLIDRKGNIAGTYSKTHLTLSEYEEGLVPGEDIPVFQTDFGTVGIAICWDMFFPEMAKIYHLEGADIICYPTAGFDKERVDVRACDNGSFVITSAVHERCESRIISPEGETLGDASEKGYAIATIDLNKPYYLFWLSCPSYTTRKNMYLHERRPDLYKRYNNITKL
ncbi:carbon-nitrogen hydrolase family protein [Acetivibrio sp. MSJd-27]|uniref:carbon-nitrogen hydrolase family protein n=1 Tax=Acetivibrio sp. MSJd-27 TaxID=2841523 RepID=UPI001C118592|nr:carbon-nitrogen hydrolase family protein [Acetivibrio sp. MSJd-27]MBU5449519.1 carbon-nitrogen hydrolase family protein [Acetivibrio sp. MSJd-27]